MENYNVYQDITNRTGGDIYIGVVGPVRTGKSTFIKRFMETLVLPNAEQTLRKEMIDELPQAGEGKTVMTTEPKFVPAQAAKIQAAKGVEISVRLVDCVGFAVTGANGFEEDGTPRLVKTPWQEAAMPFEQAAAMGTEKVIKDHSTIGVVVTTDGSFTGIERGAYVSGEEKAVTQLKAIGKPFVIVLNCISTDNVAVLKKELEDKYEVPVVAMNVEDMQETDVQNVLQAVLFTFPVNCIDVRLPKWLQTFPKDNATVEKLMQTLKRTLPNMKTMRDCAALEQLFGEDDCFINPLDIRMDMGSGSVELTIDTKPNVYYEVLSNVCGEEICDDLQLMRYVCALAQTKVAYAKVKDALEEAEKNGYGIVYPMETEYELDKPRLLKKSSGYGAHFRASAPSYHIIKVDVTGGVSPIIGTKEQSEGFIDETLTGFENGMEGVWETNIFGRSLRALVGEELSGKTTAMPMELRKKMRRTITKIVNDGKNNAICLLF